MSGSPEEPKASANGGNVPAGDVSGGRTAGELEAEVARLEQELAAAKEVAEGTPPRRTVRKVVAGILVALSVLGVVATTVAFWVHDRLLDSETYTAAILPALEDPAVTDAIGDYISDQVFEAVDLEGRFEARLTAADEFLAEQLQELLGLGDLATGLLSRLDPPQLADLAGPLALAIETPVRNAVNDFVGSEEFRNGLERAIVVAHAKAVALLRGDYDELPRLVVDSGEVRLDLVPLIATTLRGVVERGLDFIGLDAVIPLIPVAETPGAGIEQLATALGTDLPPDFGQLVVMSQDQLEELQSAMRAFDRLPWFLLAATLLLIAGAIASSLRRLRTVASLAIGTAFGMFVALLVMRRVEQAVLDAIADPDGRAAAGTVVTTVLGNLRTTLVVLMIVTVGLGIVIILSERGWLQAGWGWIRETTRPTPGGSVAQRFTAHYADPLRAGGLAVAAIALFFAGIGWPQVIIIGGLFGLYWWWITASSAAIAAESGEEPVEAGVSS